MKEYIETKATEYGIPLERVPQSVYALESQAEVRLALLELEPRIEIPEDCFVSVNPLEQTIKAYTVTLMDLNRSAQVSLEKYHDYRGKAIAMEATINALPEDTSKKVNVQQVHPWWGTPYREGDYICWNTPGVTLKWPGQEYPPVYMGKYTVCFGFKELRLRVKPHEDSIWVDSYYHPHIDTSGGVCWGNVSDQVSALMKDGDIAKLLGYLRVILETYNYESPYRDIATFLYKRDPSATGAAMEQTHLIKINEGDLPCATRHVDVHDTVEDEYEDDEGGTRTDTYLWIKAYRMCIGDTPVGAETFIRKNDGTYLLINEDLIVDTEEM